MEVCQKGCDPQGENHCFKVKMCLPCHLSMWIWTLLGNTLEDRDEHFIVTFLHSLSRIDLYFFCLFYFLICLRMTERCYTKACQFWGIHQIHRELLSDRVTHRHKFILVCFFYKPSNFAFQCGWIIWGTAFPHVERVMVSSVSSVFEDPTLQVPHIPLLKF